jgi:hypothetical protein
MLRFVISVGPAQTLFLIGALTQYRKDSGQEDTKDILLLAGHDLSNSGKQALSAMAAVGWPWHEVLSFDPYLQSVRGQKHRRIRAGDLDRTLHSYGEPDQIWFCMPHNVEEQVLMAMFPRAELHLFEDGLGTYFDLYSIPRLLRHPKRVVRCCSWAAMRNVRSLRRLCGPLATRYPVRSLTRAYLFLVPHVDIPTHLKNVPYSIVETESMREAVESLRTGLRLDTACLDTDPLAKRMLLMGQYLCGSRPDLWEQECRLYEEVVQKYHASGYEVWWKEHPRARRPFGPRLENLGGDVHVFSTNDAYPIELFVRQGMFDKSVAISSTSLITLKRLYGTEPRTLIDCLPFPLPGSFHYAHEMISRHIAGVASDFETEPEEVCVPGERGGGA